MIQFIQRYSDTDQNWYTCGNMSGKQPKKFPATQIQITTSENIAKIVSTFLTHTVYSVRLSLLSVAYR